MRGMKIARVFPTRTRMTPEDSLAFSSFQPPQIGMPEVDEVHISVTFTWDLEKAEQMAEAWLVLGVPVKLGGPAFGKPGGEFVPGLYVKEGATITSRGCPNHCPFCGVPEREGGLREMPILDGWNILDDNLLACSDEHVESVFRMLERQPRRPEFTGGLEAEFLKPWHAQRMREVGTNRIEKAERRVMKTIKAGFMPFPMVYRGKDGYRDHKWIKWANEWLRPQSRAVKVNEVIAREKIRWEE